jgi:hypothetical protein
MPSSCVIIYFPNECDFMAGDAIYMISCGVADISVRIDVMVRLYIDLSQDYGFMIPIFLLYLNSRGVL